MASTDMMMYKRLGFAKPADLKWFLLAIVPMVLFLLVRSPILSVQRLMCNPMRELASPGECYWHTLAWSRSQIALYVHLWSVFPGTLIAVLQFIPAIRTRRPRLHRMLGYACWFFGISAGISALFLMDHAFGGTRSTKAATMFLATTCFVGHFKAYRAIKAYRIDQHRAWMLRTWVYMGGILTMRPITIVAALIVTALNKRGMNLNIALPCPQVFYILNNGKNIGNFASKPDFFTTYGFDCSPIITGMTSPSTALAMSRTSPTDGYEAILSDVLTNVPAYLFTRRIDHRAAALNLGFGQAFILGIAINIVIAEWYLRRTKEESQRLEKLGAFKRKAAEQKLLDVQDKEIPSTSRKLICIPEAGTLRTSILHVKDL